MTVASSTEWAVREVETGAGAVRYRTAGEGPVLVYLPRDNGYPPVHSFLDALARDWTVIAPWYPGFNGGKTQDWTWLQDIRDLSVVTGSLLKTLGLSNAVLLGMGFGGWIGANILCSMPGVFSRAVLVAPMGVRPVHDVIYDQFLVSSEVYARKGFHDQSRFDQAFGPIPDYDQLEAWENDREMTCRIAWKPYMHHLSLARLLGTVTTQTLVVHGANDAIVPLESSELYCQAIANARLEVLPDCGHAVDLEQPEALMSVLAS